MNLWLSYGSQIFINLNNLKLMICSIFCIFILNKKEAAKVAKDKAASVFS